MGKGKKQVYVIAAVIIVVLVIIGIVIATGKDTPVKEADAISEETNANQTADVQTNAEETADSMESSTQETESEVPKYEIDPAYTLVWEDNFDGTELNRDDWNVELHEPGWVNNELQEYVDTPENIFLEDGNLVIQALKTVVKGNATYTSGRINTQNKHDFKYGRFEVRAKVPSGQGFLPAFWLMATDENLYGQWPKCGEIDIMEVLGSETKTTHGTIHYGEPHEQNQGSYTLAEGDFASEFHVFACEWEPSEIRYYVDGELFHTVNNWFTQREGIGEVTYPAPFDQPFYMILNLAVGGDWPGNPKPGVEFDETCRLTVDYVRVYQKDSYDENVTKPEKEITLREADETGNYVINSDFAEAEDLSDSENWIFYLAGTGEATAEIANNELVIKTTKEGDLEYSIQAVQGYMPMVQGTKYRLSFDAYASEPRDIITAITAPDNAWIRYLADTKVAITTEKQNYSFEFDMTESSDENGRVEFNLGCLGSTAEVHISNVRLESIGEAEVVVDAKSVLLDGNYVYNGEFHQGTDRMEYWIVESQCDGAAASVTNVDNIRELMVTVPNTVTAMDQMIVKQEEVMLSADKFYVLSFDAYADSDKVIQTKIAGQTFDSNLTTQKTNYKYAFETGNDVTDNVLQFLLGVGGTIYIDNVRIQEDGMLINGDFSNGMVGYELYAYTAGDVTYGVDGLSEDNAFSIDISNTGDLDWKIQLKQNNITLEKGKWYSISFDAKSSLDRKMMYALQRDGSSDDDWTAYSGSQTIDLTGDYQTFALEFQMNSETDVATILTFTMGAVGGEQITEKHTIRIDNIVLEEIEAPQE